MGNKKKAVWPSIPPENSRTRPESLLPPHRSWLFWPHLSSCFPDSLTECISLIHFFNGKTLLTNTFVFIAGLWTKFSWPLSKYLSEWTGMQMLGPRLMASLKLSSLSHKKEVLHVGDLLQWKTKSFYKHVIIIIFFSGWDEYFCSANYKIWRLGRNILLLPLCGYRPWRGSYT